MTLSLASENYLDLELDSCHFLLQSCHRTEEAVTFQINKIWLVIMQFKIGGRFNYYTLTIVSLELEIKTYFTQKKRSLESIACPTQW